MELNRTKYGNIRANDQLAIKNLESEERKAERDQRSAAQQLKKLDAKLGDGVGANKERARLQKEIEQ